MSGSCQKRENRRRASGKAGTRAHEFMRAKGTHLVLNLCVSSWPAHMSRSFRPLSMASTITSKHRYGELSRENCRFCSTKAHARVHKIRTGTSASANERTRVKLGHARYTRALLPFVRFSECRGGWQEQSAGEGKKRNARWEREDTSREAPRRERRQTLCATNARMEAPPPKTRGTRTLEGERDDRRAIKRAKERATLDRAAAGCARSRNTDGRSATRCGAMLRTNDGRPSERAREREGWRAGGEGAESPCD